MYNLISAYSNELYIGEDRSGKTLSMTTDTFNDIKDLKIQPKIFCNYHLNRKYFQNWSLIKKQDLVEFEKYKLEFQNCIFLIDEIHQWLNNRNFMKAEQKCITYFIGQMGKRGNVLRGTTHDFDIVDLRLRMYCRKLIYTFKGLNINNKFEQLLNYNKKLTKEENDILYVKKLIYIKKLIQTSFLPEFHYIKLSDDYIKASDFFDLYDTRELIATSET